MEQKDKKPHRVWVKAGVGFAVFWVVYLAVLAPRPRPLLENTGMSQPAEYDWTLLDRNDRPVSFAQFRGKPVFLNIWATFCDPCITELPSIARVAANPRLAGKGLQFVCVSTDESSQAVRRFLEGRSWSMTFLRAEKLPGVFLTDGLPATFVIAADGRIAAFEAGGADWDLPEVVQFLEKVAAVRPSETPAVRPAETKKHPAGKPQAQAPQDRSGVAIR
jgi:thiol-disulfide isomerase/thioredoxin